MTPADLRTAADLLLGSERFGFGLTRPLARVLGVDDRTVRRWISGASPVPEWVADRFFELAEKRQEDFARLLEIRR